MNKKTIMTAIIALLGASLFLATAINTPEGMKGEGTVLNPYQIVKLEQLANIKPDTNYILMKDLDFNNDGDYLNLKNKKEWTSGEGWKAINGMSGTLDGNKRVILNLYANRPQSNTVGLLGYFPKPGVVTDLGLIDAKISGKNNVGAIAGWGEGVILESYVSGGVVKGENRVGSLVGNLENGWIAESYATGRVFGTYHVGGLVGDSSGGIIDSYSKASVDGEGIIGGIAGTIRGGLIENSYASGLALGERGSVGTIVGENHQGEVNDCYATQPMGIRNKFNVSEDMMMTKSTFEGWDFEQVWIIEEGVSFPQLRQ